MSDQPLPHSVPPKLEKGGESTGIVPVAGLPAGGAAGISGTGQPAEPIRLTAEEQMALYEKSLKEEDWGHQPC